MWLLQPPESPQRETGRRGGGGRVDCAIRRSCLTHRKVCRERRFRRDRGGATGTVAASLVFQTSDRSGSPKPRQRVRRRLAGAPAAACRSRADDRMQPGSQAARQPGAEGVPASGSKNNRNDITEKCLTPWQAGRAAPQARPSCISGRRKPARVFRRPGRPYPRRSGGVNHRWNT